MVAIDVKIRRALTVTMTALIVVSANRPLDAAGHGPVFGAATPTLGRGGWSFDQAAMAQGRDGAATSALLRSMISFGITERLQISGSLPIPLSETNAIPSGRMMAMMSGNRDFESLLAWRFQSRPVGEGARLETTAYVGALMPLDSSRAGTPASPAGLVSLTSGYASRSHYVWGGASYVRPAERRGERLGSVTSFSLVYGYRPPAWRKDYPKPDLRFFVEATGDITAASLHNGESMAETGGRVALIGPTLLLLYKAYALEGGIQVPFYQRNGSMQADERFRVGLNFTVFFWPSKGKGH
jgi:hypothetical protein